MNKKTFFFKLVLLSFYLFGIGKDRICADVNLPLIFTNNMVPQRNQINRIWGAAEVGEKISVSIARQNHTTRANKDGNWQVEINPMPSSKVGYTLTVEGQNRIEIEDVLVGEVWLCSGQSNMEWPVSATYDSDIEKIISWNPYIRLISVPKLGTQEAQTDFQGEWNKATPKFVMDFSAVGFFFGRILHQSLDVPVGLIDNSWGGSVAEAWMSRNVLEGIGAAEPYLEKWSGIEKIMTMTRFCQNSI